MNIKKLQNISQNFINWYGNTFKEWKILSITYQTQNKKAQKYFNLFKHNCFSIGRAGTYSYLVDIDDSIYQSLEIKKIIENNSWKNPIIGEEFKFNL